MTPEGLIELHEQCISVEELAKLTGRSKDMLRYYCRNGKLKYEKIEGTYFIYKSSLGHLFSSLQDE